MRKSQLVGAAALIFFGPLPVQAQVVSGTISNWPESGPLQIIGDGTNNVTAFWSINTFDRGYFYGSAFTGDSDAAIAVGVSAITDITDASLLGFVPGDIGPLCDADCAGNGVGDFVVLNNVNTGHYGVLRIDDIVGNGGDATLNATWWFQTDGTGNFALDSETDTDSDGVLDDADLCPATLPGEPVDANGCAANEAIDLAVAALFTLIDSPVSDKARDKLSKAQDKLNEALSELGQGDVKKALKKVGDAVKELLKAEDEGAEVDELIERLVELARAKAQFAIDEAIAAGGDSKKISKAQEELLKADDDLAEGKPDKAIDNYAKAWDEAEKS